MATLVTRELGATATGSPLTNAQADQNFLDLDLDVINIEAKVVDNNITLNKLNYKELLNTSSKELHRSPNAVTAMFVYDTSKDSDNGAWTERCQHTSWYNEPLCGNWIKADVNAGITNELAARALGGVLGPNLMEAANTDISKWTPRSISDILSLNDGVLRMTNPSSGGAAAANYTQTVTAGKAYLLKSSIWSLGNSTNAPTIRVSGDNGSSWTVLASNTSIGCYVIIPTTNTILIQPNNTNTQANLYTEVAQFSLQEVISFANSNDYYQLATDGKFYRLWNNIFRYSDQFDNTIWSRTFLNVTANATANPIVGSLSGADLLIPTTTNENHYLQSSIGSGFNYIELVAKASGYSCIGFSDGSNNFTVKFDLTGSGGASVENGSPTSISIFALADGWYRCRFRFPAVINSSQLRIYIRPNASGSVWTPYAGDGTSGVIFATAQQTYFAFSDTYEAKGAEGSVSEVFRGNKRDFPRLAGIVTESSSVSIYDLTEPGRPMWMRFTGATNNAIPGAGIQCVHARCAEMFVGTGGNTAGDVLFARDVCYRVGNGTSGQYLGNIASRNSASGFLSGGGSISGNSVTAVSMVVLPDAPIDLATGLSIPTIAVATTAGASVIKHTRDMVRSSSGSAYGSLTLTPTLLSVFSTNSTTWEFAYNPGSLSNSFALSSKALNAVPDFGSFGNHGLIQPKRAELIRRASAAAVAKLINNEGTVGRGIGATITNTFNTGHQIGDIRRTYLSDVGAGSAVGGSIIADPTFQLGVGSWTGFNATISTTGPGNLTATQVAAGVFGFSTTLSGLVVGNTYTILLGLGSGISFDNGSGANNSQGSVRINGSVVSNFGRVTDYNNITFTAASGTATLDIVNGFPYSASWSLKYVHVLSAVVSERSYKDNAYVHESGTTGSVPIAGIVTGTLTKTEVASDAQLVGYSGWSNTNYLRELYSSDLDFGTGEFNISAWVSINTSLPVENFPTVGSELVTDTSFNSPASWVISSGWTVSNGLASRISTGATDSIRQAIAITANKIYRVTINVDSIASGALRIGLGTNSWSVSTSVAGLQSFIITAASTDNFIYLIGSSGFVGTLTGISVAEAGAVIITDRSHSSNSKFNLGIDGVGRFVFNIFDGTNSQSVTSNTSYNIATWLKVEAIYQTGRLSIRVNGSEVASTVGNPLLTLNNSNAVLTIGNNYSLDAPFPGLVSLLKLSATAPTPDQSVWMYEQEKQMFNPGAQICLPDSNNILDLAYDSETDEWISTSSSNKSRWNGLIRTVTEALATGGGSYNKITANSNIELVSRTSINPGVYLSKTEVSLQEKLLKRQQQFDLIDFDYVGGFTANITNGSAALASVTNQSVPANTTVYGALIEGVGIPSNTVLIATNHMSAAATATTNSLQINFRDFILPIGYEARTVSVNGVFKQEGSTKDWTRLFDGFREIIRFAVAPGNTAWIEIKAVNTKE